MSLTTRELWTRESRKRCLGSAEGGRNNMASESARVAAMVVDGVNIELVRRRSIDNDIGVRYTSM